MWRIYSLTSGKWHISSLAARGSMHDALETWQRRVFLCIDIAAYTGRRCMAGDEECIVEKLLRLWKKKKVPRLFGTRSSSRQVHLTFSPSPPSRTRSPFCGPPSPHRRSLPSPPAPTASTLAPSPPRQNISFPAMKPVGSLSLGRKLPSAGSLLVGILVGLLVASVCLL